MNGKVNAQGQKTSHQRVEEPAHEDVTKSFRPYGGDIFAQTDAQNGADYGLGSVLSARPRRRELK